MSSLFRAVTVGSVLIAMAASLGSFVGCGGTSSADKMKDNKMGGEKMKDDKMSDDKMGGEKMKDRKMKEDKMGEKKN